MLKFLRNNTPLPTRITVGSREIPLIIRRNKRAKRICLRVNTKDRAINLTLPQRAKLEQGMDFLHRKQDWLAEAVSDLPEHITLEDGAYIPILGEARHIIFYPATRFSYELLEDRLIVHGSEAKETDHILRALKECFREFAIETAEHYAAHIRRRVNRISLRDPRTRWGSCSQDGNISLSWRLVFAPLEVTDYVIAHEVAHLRHMNHSARFWECVEGICPDYREHWDWLRSHGHQLFCYGE